MATMKKISFEILSQRDTFVEDVNRELRILMTESPDYVYRSKSESTIATGCSYVNGPNPGCKGCIIGQAMQRLGVPIDDQNLVDGRTVRHLLTKVGVNVSTRWIRIQSDQDCGESWGSLLKYLPAE